MIIKLTDTTAIRADGIIVSDVRSMYLRIGLASGDVLDIYPVPGTSAADLHDMICNVMAGHYAVRIADHISSVNIG